ncbi:hypothetical protein [Reyranella massiliensis]|uniref:hypothetical protein n=1 Tax=Reyranella massiliensis TaxID=445220 RepID=UPI000317819E|nr:hypothetical protein [Reyranella massiliensis]
MTAISREFRAQSQPRRGLRRIEAAAYIGVSPTKFDEMVKDRRMPGPKRIDGATVWDLVQLDRAFEALPDEGGGSSWD